MRRIVLTQISPTCVNFHFVSINLHLHRKGFGARSQRAQQIIIQKSQITNHNSQIINHNYPRLLLVQ